MTDTIDMSLDDIIKKNRKTGGGRGKARGVGRAIGRGAGATRGKRYEKALSVENNPVVKRFDYQRRTFRGAARGGRPVRGLAKSPYRRGNANNTWTHDLVRQMIILFFAFVF